MPSVSLSPVFNGWQGFLSNGLPATNGHLQTFLAGTSTPVITYQDAAGSVPNATSIALDAGGRPPAEIWIPDGLSVKFVFLDGDGNTIGTYDNIPGNLLSGPSGSASVGFLQAGTGAVATTAQAKMRERVTPADFGIVADGSDETSKVRSWLAQAAVAGALADGLNKTIGVSGSLDISAYVGLKWIRTQIKQLAPSVGGATLKTIYALGNPSLELRKITLNRNGDGTSGSLDSAAGMWFQQCPDLLSEDCEVYGNDAGAGMVFYLCERLRVVRPYAHDIRYVQVAQVDDTVAGIRFANSDGFQCTLPRVEKMGRTDQTVASRDRFSRGITVGGCRNFTIQAPAIYRVDQGIDVSGSGGNLSFDIEGGAIRHCYSVGVKLANSAVGGNVVGVVAESIGLYSFLCSGPTSNQLNVTQDNTFDACKSRNVGSANVFPIANCKGFSSEVGSAATGAYLSYPKSTKWRNDDALSDQGAATVTVSSATALAISNATPIPCSLGVRIRFTTTGALPTGLAVATDYWLVPIRDTMTVGVATSYINALDADELLQQGLSASAKLVNTLAGGSGTNTLTLMSNMGYGYFDSVPLANLDIANPTEALNCRSRGEVNYPFFGVRSLVVIANGIQTFPSNASYQDVVPPNEEQDSMGLFATGIYTVPRSDYYRVRLDGYFTPNATGVRYAKVQESVPGGPGYVDIEPQDLGGNWGGAIQTEIGVEIIKFWLAGTLLKTQVLQNSGSSLDLAMRLTIFPATVYGGGAN